MNPFEDEDIETNTTPELLNTIHVEIRLEIMGRKKNTYITGYTLTEEEFKKIKKVNGCNGSMKKNQSGELVIQFQGDLVQYIYNFLTEKGIDHSNIRIIG